MWPWTFRNLVLAKLDQLIAAGVKTMAEIDDLKAAVSAEAQVITNLAAEIDSAISKITQPGISAADVEAAAQAIQGFTSTLQTSATNLQNALNPAQPAPPSNP